MNPAEQSKSAEKVNLTPEQGYIDMTVGSSSSTSSKGKSWLIKEYICHRKFIAVMTLSKYTRKV